ncbi:hypothetical protein TRAPUB_10753 [Trametes pubescens]|uniref:Uncharacterized protein n=1 Tax=Trametes pubescens TaxID=154538 RepID=A0A1M2VYQ4_TRAPU|nr:hypothetical protein TRAPUB_10753 [Trametes pubescens]
MHCVPASPTSAPSGKKAPDDASNTSTGHNKASQGETPGWESCGRIVEKERADFYEFIACNLFIGIVALTLVLARSKRLQALQARQLAARIGLVRSSPNPGGWSNG